MTRNAVPFGYLPFVFEELKNLQDNWVSHGDCKPPSDESIKSARALVDSLFITADDEGGVALEWRLGHIDVTIQIASDGSVWCIHTDVDDFQGSLLDHDLSTHVKYNNAAIELETNEENKTVHGVLIDFETEGDKDI